MPDDPLTCLHHERLAEDIREIKDTVFRIEDNQGAEKVTSAKHGVRLGIVEKVVYGGVGLVLVGVGYAVLTLLREAWAG